LQDNPAMPRGAATLPPRLRGQSPGARPCPGRRRPAGRCARRHERRAGQRPWRDPAEPRLRRRSQRARPGAAGFIAW